MATTNEKTRELDDTEPAAELKLWAYYYSFEPTGQRPVDLILHAVARAGKAYHHTENWSDQDTGEWDGCEGRSPRDWIQNAANRAAALLAAHGPMREALEAGIRSAERSKCALCRRARGGHAVWCAVPKMDAALALAQKVTP